MNKFLLTAVLAGGLLLLDSPEAAAHGQGHNKHRSPPVYKDYYRGDAYGSHRYSRDRYRGDYRRSAYRRSHKMPYWLRHDRGFRHWYEHSRLRRDRYLAWQVLFDIYRWEFGDRHYYRH